MRRTPPQTQADPRRSSIRPSYRCGSESQATKSATPFRRGILLGVIGVQNLHADLEWAPWAGEFHAAVLTGKSARAEVWVVITAYPASDAAPASSGGIPAAPNSAASSSPCGGRSRTAAPLPCGSDPPRQPPAEPPHRAPRSTSPAPRRNRQGAMSGAFLRRRDRTARSLRMEHYSAAVNTLLFKTKTSGLSLTKACASSSPGSR